MANKIDKEKIARLEKEKDAYLKKHPELKQLQKKVDKALENITDPLERAKITNKVMMDSCKKMLDKTIVLNNKLKELNEYIKEYQLIHNTDLN